MKKTLECQGYVDATFIERIICGNTVVTYRVRELIRNILFDMGEKTMHGSEFGSIRKTKDKYKLKVTIEVEKL